MEFSDFCNICYKRDVELKNICADETSEIKDILLSFVGHMMNREILDSDVFLCVSCCKDLESFDAFREMIFGNVVHFEQQYQLLKAKLERENDPDIERKLEEFVKNKVGLSNNL